MKTNIPKFAPKDRARYPNTRDRVFLSAVKRLESCLKKYDEDKVEGKKYLLRLMLAQAIRGARSVRVVKPTDVKGSQDERALIVRRVTSRYNRHQRFYIEQQCDWLASLLEYAKD